MRKRLLGFASFLLPLAAGQALMDADVHVTPPDYVGGSTMSLREPQVEMRGVSMLALVQRAYGFDADLIVGGPRRLDFDKYDIVAKIPPGTKPDAIPAMLKPLLAERFQLVVKEETRPMMSYVLVQSKGKHKLEAAQGNESRCTTELLRNAEQPARRDTCKGYTATQLAGLLRGFSRGFLPGPVADQTGLQGTWDFTLELPMAGGASIVSAVENQLGLRLEQGRVDTPVLRIESVNSVPTPNAPGVPITKPAPPEPMVLEVATVKPSAPGAPNSGINIRRHAQGAQFEARGESLRGLISFAFNIPMDRVVGLPPGADDQSFDVVAGLSGPSASSLEANLPALQQILKERFKFVGHIEDRPVDAYNLVAVKPRMAKADPANRASCKSGPAPGAKDPREVTPGRSVLQTCLNVTMDEFAERIAPMAGGLLRSAAVNATGLEGTFDFTINYSPRSATAAVSAGANTAGAGPAPLVAADPSDNITFLEALTSQLGLKLELVKRPAPHMVVDHVEKMPTEN